VTPSETPSLSINGSRPASVARPGSVAEAADLIRAARATGTAIYPHGGGTHQYLGGPPTRPGTVVDGRGLNAVIDYPARDLTVTVQAGITLAALAALLAAEGQELPVDVPNPEIATLGGALATNRSGPRRLSRGTLRDALIGVSFLTDEGVEVKGGGRVVKNVAGYDLMKLHVGALGTLGLLTQVTLKLTPLAEERAFVAFGLNAATVGPTLDRLHASHARPGILELVNAAAARKLGVALPGNDEWVIVAGFEEKRVTVAYQVATLKAELATAPVREVTEFRGPAATALLTALTQNLAEPAEGVSFKASVLPSRLAAFALDAAAHHGAAVHAHALVGVVTAHLPADVSREDASTLLARLAPKDGGSLVVRRCPPAWKAVLPGLPSTGVNFDLMRAVKRTLDPHDVFNPGRLFRDAERKDSP
jgi:glycolate oxidase FAD binding subunit